MATANADLGCEGYRILTMVQGSIGLPPVPIGVPGRCRFCGATDARVFRHEAHTLPEAFGNKWVTSLDECDRCNARFGAFDDALVKSMGAVLTVGGVKGKHNKVRQTGRRRSCSDPPRPRQWSALDFDADPWQRDRRRCRD